MESTISESKVSKKEMGFSSHTAVPLIDLAATVAQRGEMPALLLPENAPKTENAFKIASASNLSKYSLLSPSSSSFCGEETVILNSLQGKNYLGKLLAKEKETNGFPQVEIEGKGKYLLCEVSGKLLLDRKACEAMEKTGAKTAFIDANALSEKARMKLLGAIARAYAKLHEEGKTLGRFEMENMALSIRKGELSAEFTDLRSCEKTNENPLSDFLYSLSTIHNRGLATVKEIREMILQYLSTPLLLAKAKEHALSFGQACDALENLVSFLLQKVLSFCRFAEMISHEKEQKRKRGLAYAVY
ncbi:hypothetical protein COV61_00590 [Candidatus Micrarchaeota archaeon CG11_big_fil_rev_8_21_14_0_20_47_5]|nr:MAG: hypothetical protein AUJ17_04205 [Candidatus Micrarchaeota archaeon CG1_02_47_40]PIN84274.1 MAG: hypothetical protein COV61_00590 [Candidatus Micrarchaeota archaeon CG11_big_fil_rev_8_21_14_0_20_47_5]QBM01438.1 hypothetical protein [uncultured archaeon]